jgi:hypothetical protein
MNRPPHLPERSLTLKYAVTFESNTQPALTVRGEVSGSTTQSWARLAMKSAMSQARGRRWSSITILLDKGDE